MRKYLTSFLFALAVLLVLVPGVSQARGDATLYWQGDIKLPNFAFEKLVVDPVAHRLSGDWARTDTIRSNAGDEASTKESYFINGGWNSETGRFTGNVSGSRESNALYKDGSNGRSGYTLSGTLEGTVINRSRIVGTATITYPSSYKDGSVSAPPASGTTSEGLFTLDLLSGGAGFVTNASDEEEFRGEITAVEGEGEIIRAKTGKSEPFSIGMKVERGDRLMTSVDSRVTITFGHGTLVVSPLTQLRIDEFVSKENLEKTQLFLHIGTVQAKVKHTPSIRSDFSVHYPPSGSASIRGSEMRVRYDPGIGAVIHAIEDTTYIVGPDGKETTLPEQMFMRVSTDGMLGIPQSAEADDVAVTKVPTPAPFSSIPLVGMGAIVLVAIIASILYFRRRRRS